MTQPLPPRALYAFGACSFGALALLSVATLPACEDAQPSSTGGAPSAGSNASAGAGANIAGAAMGGTAGSGASGGTGPGGGGTAAGFGGGGGGTVACKVVTPVNGSGLTLSATDISAFKYAPPPSRVLTKMAYDPVSQLIVMIDGVSGALHSMDPTVALPAAASGSPVTTTKPYDSGYKADDGYGAGTFAPYRGLAFDKAGNLYVLAVRGGDNVGVNIKKGAPGPAGAPRTWSTIVITSEGFPASGTDYDHTFSGIAVSQDDLHLYISSGSRTEHGEVRGALREVPLSSAILKVPTSGMTDLKNDDAALAPFLFADGLRNAFDLAFNAAGDLIGTENGPDMDLPDEINFLEHAKHYGFPWRFGDVDNPTRDAAYTKDGDQRLQAGYGAINSYVADPTFPPPPGAFTDPIRNMGPDANFMRVDRNASTPTKAGAEGLAGITGHRSPLGLAFDVEGKLCGEYYKQGFVLSYGALVPASFNDPGEDLLLLGLTKGATGYTMTAKQIAKGIKAPMDSVLVGNRLFTIGYGNAAQIFVFELPTP